MRLHYADLDAKLNRRTARANERLAQLGVPVRFTNLLSVWSTSFTEPGRYHWLLQYYLRDAGLMLSWIGTGRFIFSHDYSDDDFDEFMTRFETGVLSMQQDGWWWRDASLTPKTIRKRLVREIVVARFGRERA